ncbi:MAG: hypothetical protein JW913_17125 [Chitinispirillaceae bacterium]|nr:hypothetical protein [Chitinispirillaceae bacterium]
MSFSLRFIIDPPRGAAFNMAADLRLMEQCAAGSIVVVRLYSWQPATVTIGRMQRSRAQLDDAALTRDGVSWIRRPTGGRAVLHCEDLTYSCIFPRTVAAMGKSVNATYATITRCLVRGLKEAGIETTVQDSASPLIRSGRNVKLPCFLAPNRNEIMARGRKLVGSAQYRSDAAVLQHGSLPLTAAYRGLPRYLPLPHGERERQTMLLEEKSIALNEIDPAIKLPELITALEGGFTATLECGSIGQPWSNEELAEIVEMSRDSLFRERWQADPPRCDLPDESIVSICEQSE